jgi:hypothetical protein
MVLVAVLALLEPNFLDEIPPKEVPVKAQFYYPRSYGPSLSEVGMHVNVVSRNSHDDGVLTMPVPSDYSGQTVINFKVEANPPSALKSWKWVLRPDGLNRVVEIVLNPSASEVNVGYSARVLAPSFPVLRTQHKNFKDWIGPTTSISSDDPQAITLAQELSEDKPERDEFVGRVVRSVAALPGFTTSPELSNYAMKRAYLCAAVLRSQKIPARLVAGIPIWGQGYDAESWWVEYPSQEGNWVIIDPLAGIHYPSRNSLYVLAIPSRRDESKAASNFSAVLPAAPALSTPEISSGLRWAKRRPLEKHTSVHLFGTYSRSTNARLMPAAVTKSQKLTPGFLKGEGYWIDDGKFNRILMGGPIDLALFMDGTLRRKVD